MELFATIGLGMVGFLIGNLLFSKVGMWIATIYEIARAKDGESTVAKLASVSLLSAGPWFLVATALFAVYVRFESWAPPLFVGAVIAILFFSILTLYMARKEARAKHENAA